jgi:ubiquinone/menaquinone biosynthesis C-methylase UbiE
MTVVAAGGDLRPAVKYGDADGYEAYMGRWSAALAPRFLEFAAVGKPASLLDVGAGTGNLLAAASLVFPEARLVGIDPSAVLLRRARSRRELAGAELIEGGADALPFAGDAFDCCLSLLVLQEFSDRLGPLREMRRVTRQAGIVAACQWDFSRMPIIAALVDAIASVDPDAGQRLAVRSPRLFADEAALTKAWRDAGLDDVSAGPIAISERYRDFDELWLSLLGGSTPSTMTLASLPLAEREIVRERMRNRLAGTAEPQSFTITATALVVRGAA